MASSTAQPMPDTIEAYKELAQRDHDLIVEMKAAHQAEVSKLKARINKLEQKPQLYTFGESSTEIHDEENSPFKRIKGNE